MRRLVGLVLAFALCASLASAQSTPPLVGAFYRQALSASSPQTCTSVLATAAHGFQIINASAAQTATLAVYDEGASPTCAAADLVYSAVLGANAQVTLGVPGAYVGSSSVFFRNGFAYTLSAAATGTISLQPF